MRGSPLTGIDGRPCIASFFPQDAVDFKNYEQTLNPLSKNYDADGEVSDDDEEEGDVKRFSKTKRSNYSFWLQADVRKCKTILQGRVERYVLPAYRIYPSSDETIKVLSQAKNITLDLDLETNYERQDMLCFAFSVDDGKTIYSVPVLDYNYSWAYSALPYIIRSLAVAIRDNMVVCHNGAGFDFFVLASKYKIPVRKPYDTMLTQHRIFPDIEKSLGHMTSYWLWEKFHKDSDSQAYFTQQHMMDKLRYCAKDVYTMSLCRQKQNEYAIKIPGLLDSINTAQNSIRPYLTATIQGISYNKEKLEKVKKENDLLMMHYMRAIRVLIGETAMEEVKKSVKGKAKGFPSSNTQCCYYFHEMLGYPILMRSAKTHKPSLGKKIMFRLALKFPDNPVITLVLMYRILAKEYSSLKFIPFKDDEGKIIDPTKYSEQLQS